MEGPSLVLASEEFEPFIGKKIISSIVPASLGSLDGGKIIKTESWGKHFIIHFNKYIVRIHFLMFGSYRINHPRENRIPKLQLNYKNDTIYFYSCAIKQISEDDVEAYDHSVDLMSDEWNHKKALKAIEAKPDAMICDLLMNQDIFSGLGNIMKNEILFRCRLHPELKVSTLDKKERSLLVKESKKYAQDFYEWKKINQLKRHWLVMRKKKCPVCGRNVIIKPTGKLKRLSHFCNHCQKFRKA